MTGDVLDVVRAHLDAFNARDAEAVTVGFAPDAVFHNPDGVAVGHREILALFREAFAQQSDATLEMRSAVTSGDTAACELAERIAWAGGDEAHLHLAVFFTVKDGLLARVRIYRDVGV